MLRFVCCRIVYRRGPLSSVAGSKYAKMFGERLREVRESQGLSQEELAHSAGLHRTHISLIERGARSIRIETIERLCLALRSQPGDLMPPVRLRARSDSR